MAAAIAARCAIPPEISCGYRSRARRGQVYAVAQFTGGVRRSEYADYLVELIADGPNGVNDVAADCGTEPTTFPPQVPPGVGARGGQFASADVDPPVHPGPGGGSHRVRRRPSTCRNRIRR